MTRKPEQDAPADRRSTAKREQILEGAREVFRDQGFEGASVDDIARHANVSKATLYNHFCDKAGLFRAYVDIEIREHARRIFDVQADADDVEATLREIAYNTVDLICSNFGQSMCRTVTAEALRFPELARSFFDSGPASGYQRMAQLLATFVAKGQLDIPDLELAAHQFGQMCHSIVHDRVMFGIVTTVSEDEKRRVADGAVDTFLRAFGKRS